MLKRDELPTILRDPSWTPYYYCEVVKRRPDGRLYLAPDFLPTRSPVYRGYIVPEVPRPLRWYQRLVLWLVRR